MSAEALAVFSKQGVAKSLSLSVLNLSGEPGGCVCTYAPCFLCHGAVCLCSVLRGRACARWVGVAKVLADTAIMMHSERRNMRERWSGVEWERRGGPGVCGMLCLWVRWCVVA